MTELFAGPAWLPAALLVLLVLVLRGVGQARHALASAHTSFARIPGGLRPGLVGGEAW